MVHRKGTSLISKLFIHRKANCKYFTSCWSKCLWTCSEDRINQHFTQPFPKSLTIKSSIWKLNNPLIPNSLKCGDAYKYITLQTETWEGNTYTVHWTYFSSFGWLNGSQWKKIKVTASQYTKTNLQIYKMKWICRYIFTNFLY